MWHVTLDMWQVRGGEHSLKCLWNTGVGKHQGSTNLLSLLSDITETLISHGNFYLKIMYKIPKKCIFVRETIYCYTKSEINFLQKKSWWHRNKFLFTETTFFWVYFRETYFCHWIRFLHRKKSVSDKSFCQRKKASVKEASW